VLFIIFIDDVLSRLEKANTHPPVIIRGQVVGLLFVYSLAVGATTRTGLQRAISSINNFCEEWSLKINVAKTKKDLRRKGNCVGTRYRGWVERR
jgi:hypothetical protein